MPDKQVVGGTDTAYVLAQHRSRLGVVEDVGRAGKSGALPGNSSLELLRSMANETPAPEPHMATILNRNPKIRPEQNQNRNAIYHCA